MWLRMKTDKTYIRIKLRTVALLNHPGVKSVVIALICEDHAPCACLFVGIDLPLFCRDQRVIDRDAGHEVPRSLPMDLCVGRIMDGLGAGHSLQMPERLREDRDTLIDPDV